MAKIIKNKKLLVTIVTLIIVGAIVTFIVLQNKKNNSKANINNDNSQELVEPNKENNKNEYTITFNSNGGTLVESIKVKENEKITKPVDPTRSGYTFTGWKLNEKDFDFASQINTNITLTATWKKNENTSLPSTSNDNNSDSKKPNNSALSTINKINLNDYISITINYYNYAQPGGYYFITNLAEVLPNLAGKSKIVIGFDDENEECDIKLSEWSEAFSKFTFDTNRENQAKNTLENILNKKYKGINMTITGGSTMVAFSENHGVGYKYEYATIGNKTFKNLNTELENIRTNFKNEFKGIFNEAIYVVYPGYGVYPYYDKLLTDEVCGQFNLVCDRW